MNDLSVTPENIVEIRFSYKPDATAPFAIKNFASIAVIIDTGQYINIGLDQVLTYIKMLELKALINGLGEVVTATESSRDGEKYTIINLSTPPAPPDPTAQVTIVNNTPYKLAVIQNDVQGTILGFVYQNSTQVITRSNSNYQFYPVEVEVGLPFPVGVYNATQFVLGAQVAQDVNVPYYSGNIGTFSGAVDTIVIDQINIQVQNNYAFSPMLFFDPNVPINGTSKQLGVVVAPSTPAFIDSGISHTGVPITVYNPDAGTIDVFIYRQGVLVDTFLAVPSQVLTVLGVAVANWDAIQFGVGTPPPVGIAAQARTQNGTVGICAVGATTVYTDDGNITTGKTVYTDIALTIPLAGFTNIVNASTGVAYAIDNVTGVVGAATGLTCIPPTGKNIFVRTTSGTVDVTVDGAAPVTINTTGQNLVVNASSVIGLSVGKTITFYQSPPFIPANITGGSGTPIFGTGYNMPTDISNYNYLVLS